MREFSHIVRKHPHFKPAALSGGWLTLLFCIPNHQAGLRATCLLIPSVPRAESHGGSSQSAAGCEIKGGFSVFCGIPLPQTRWGKGASVMAFPGSDRWLTAWSLGHLHGGHQECASPSLHLGLLSPEMQGRGGQGCWVHSHGGHWAGIRRTLPRRHPRAGRRCLQVLTKEAAPRRSAAGEAGPK